MKESGYQKVVVNFLGNNIKNMGYKMNGFSGFGNSPVKQKIENYTYKLVSADGKTVKNISKKEYIKYKNEPGTDKPTKTTNDPDVYGRKKGGSP